MDQLKQESALAGRPWRYAAPAVVLHWLLAVLLATLLGVGWYMMSIEHEPGADWYFNLHKSVGIVVFGLVLLRLLWRLGHRPAPLPAYMPAWQVKLALATEWALYGCMFLMPLLGFLGASYSRDGVIFFGIPLPAWVTPSHDTAETFFELHENLAWIMVGLISLHVAGALKHLVIDKDDVVKRMGW